MIKMDYTEFLNCKDGLVKVSTPHCYKCKMLTPIFEQLEKEKGIKTFDIDGEMYPEMAEKYNIRSVPFIFIFKNGEIVFQSNGYLSYNELSKLF